jgi:hypothetical protein
LLMRHLSIVWSPGWCVVWVVRCFIDESRNVTQYSKRENVKNEPIKPTVNQGIL